MNLFQRLQGIINTFFQIGGPAAPGIANNNNDGTLQVRNATNTGFAVLQGATPVTPNDLANKSYVDNIFKPIVVSAQVIAPSALIANTGTEKWTVVTTAGTGAAAAYTLGAILWDNGTSVGNVTVITPVIGDEIVTTAAFTGGVISFVANSNYLWASTSTWILLATNTPGATIMLQMVLAAGTNSSTTLLPSGAVVSRCDVVITTGLGAAGTVSVGQAGDPTRFQATTDNTATVVGIYEAEQSTSAIANAAVLVTTAGTFAPGAGFVNVFYSVPVS
jgi:hypothetical protein